MIAGEQERLPRNLIRLKAKPAIEFTSSPSTTITTVTISELKKNRPTGTRSNTST